MADVYLLYSKSSWHLASAQRHDSPQSTLAKGEEISIHQDRLLAQYWFELPFACNQSCLSVGDEIILIELPASNMTYYIENYARSLVL